MPGLLSLLQRLKTDEKECRIIVLGLDNSGKTTVLKQLGGEDANQVAPTHGFEVKSLQKEHCRLNMWVSEFFYVSCLYHKCHIGKLPNS